MGQNTGLFRRLDVVERFEVLGEWRGRAIGSGVGRDKTRRDLVRPRAAPPLCLELRLT